MRIRIVRRWAVVAADVALLCGLPVTASAPPVNVPQLTAGQLRARILASADESYAGYAESNATFGLPPVSGLTGLTSPLNGVTKMRSGKRRRAGAGSTCSPTPASGTRTSSAWPAAPQLRSAHRCSPRYVRSTSTRARVTVFLAAAWANFSTKDITA